MKKLFLLLMLVGCKEQPNIKKFATNTITVTISGQVKKPGTYILPVFSQLNNLIVEAGGLLLDADINTIDHHRILRQDEHIEIYKKNDNKININTANIIQLKSLPGIGETTAKKIIEFRKKEAITNETILLKIKGLTNKKIEKFISYIRFK